MALKIADRVKETTVTTGTGTITLAGAVTGFRTFTSVLSTNDTTYYAIVGSNQFEVGLGTLASSTTLTRDTVLASSNSGSKVDFSAGSKNVFITQPAGKAVFQDASGNIADLNTDKLSEGSTNLYLTNERIDDRVNALLVAGSNVTLTYDDTANTLTIAATEDNLSNNDTDDLAEGSSNLYFTNARADARVNLQTGANLDLSNKSTSDLSEGTNLYYTDTRFDTRLAAKTTDNLSEGSSNLYFTNERVDDRVNGLLVAGSNITLTYDDTANTLTIAGVEDNLSNNDTDDLAEGSSNLYYTDERVDDRVSNLIQNGTGISFAYNDTAGTLTPTVSLSSFSTSDLSEGTNLYYTSTRFDSAFSGKSTSDLSEGTNQYHTTERVQDVVGGQFVTNGSHTGISFAYDDANDGAIDATVSLSSFDTDNLSEGSSNLYFTNARARGALSVSGDLSYNSSTGVFSFTQRTDAQVRGLFSGGTGVTYNSSTGAISIGQAVSTSSDVTFNDVVVSGDLTVSGTTTNVNTETINLADNVILLNSNFTGASPTENAGIEIERGTQTNKTLIWNETDDKWSVGSETFVASTFEGNLTGNVTGTVSSLSNHDTDDLSEGSSNLYYTSSRFDSAFSGKSTSDLSEGTNLYLTQERVEDYVGGMVSGNTETGIAVTYDDTNGKLNFIVGTLNQDTTGNAATATALETARNFSLTGDVTASAVSFDGTGNVALSTDIAANTVGITELNVSDGTSGQVLTTNGSGTLSFTTVSSGASTEDVQDIVGGMVTGNTETGITVTYEDSDGTLDFVVASQTDENFTTTLKNKLDGIEASATADQTDAEIKTAYENNSDTNAFTDALLSKLNGIEAGATADQTSEEIQDIVGAMLSGNTETGMSVTYQDADGTIDFEIASSQTAISSILNASLVIGRDADNDIDFATDNNMIFRVAAADQIVLKDGVLEPVTDDDVDLGSSTKKFKDAFIDGTLDLDNLKVSGGQGTDGQVLTSTGTGVAWEDAAGGTATSIQDADGDTKVQCEESADEDKVRIDAGGTQIATFDSDGLKFFADTASANALDDYEEGTWTPAGVGVTFTSSYGHYQKIGNRVFVSWYVQFPSTSNGDHAQIDGLPFNAKDFPSNPEDDANRGFFTIGYNNNGNSGNGFRMLISTGTNNVLAFDFAGSSIANSAFSGTAIYGGGSYIT